MTQEETWLNPTSVRTRLATVGPQLGKNIAARIATMRVTLSSSCATAGIQVVPTRWHTTADNPQDCQARSENQTAAA
jgi:hypothetical protein